MKKKCLIATVIYLVLISTITVFAGQWKQDSLGWWYDNGDGTWPAKEWQWIDGNNDGVAECYYFNENGYLLINTTTSDGYVVNTDGAWIENGIVQKKNISNIGEGNANNNQSNTNTNESNEPDKVEDASSISADYAYMAGVDFRRIRNTYNNATGTSAYVYAYTDLNGDLCVLTEVHYKIISNYIESTLHNITEGTRITSPAEYYTDKALRYFGASKLKYIELSGEVIQHRIKMLEAMSNILKGGENTYDGVFVGSATLNL